MSISPNTTIAQHTIVSKIVEDGMGVVYRTRNPTLGRDVAIKVPAANSYYDLDRVDEKVVIS